MKFLRPVFHNWYRNLIRHPKHRWWIILASFLYLLSPIDIAPDAIPFIGWLDDGLITTLLVTEVSQLLLERLKTQKNKFFSSSKSNSNSSVTIVDVDAVSVN